VARRLCSFSILIVSLRRLLATLVEWAAPAEASLGWR
jgi:hypothetical protein